MLHEELKKHRLDRGLSQEKIAEMLGVSRQAVTKWESGQTTPSTDNLLALAEIYHISLDELLGKNDASKGSKAGNPILRANLTRIAILCQTICLNTVIQEYEFRGTPFWYIFVFVPLLASSVWMAYNLGYEKDAVQRKKNTRIELLYCVIQSVIALTGYYTKMYFPTAVALIVVCLFYIFHINPKYMNRLLVRKKG